MQYVRCCVRCRSIIFGALTRSAPDVPHEVLPASKVCAHMDRSHQGCQCHPIFPCHGTPASVGLNGWACEGWREGSRSFLSLRWGLDSAPCCACFLCPLNYCLLFPLPELPQLWNVHGNRNVVMTYMGHPKPVRDICFSNDGRHFLRFLFLSTFC